MLLPKQCHIGKLEVRIPQVHEIFTGDSTALAETDIELEEEAEEEKPQEAVFPIEEVEDTTLAEVPVEIPAEMPVEIPAEVPAAIPVEVSAPSTVEEDTTQIDTRIFLKTFYRALANADSTAIRVVHYGDSQIEEDRMTTQVRRALQNRYGGGGVGLIPLHQTIGTRTLWQAITMNGVMQTTNGGPKRYLIYGPPSYRRGNSYYGPMGQVAVLDNELVAGSEDISLHVKAGSKNYAENYFNRIRVWKTGDISVTVNSALEQHNNVFVMPDSTLSAIINLNGKGDVYGISLENDKGIMVDNIPMRGCSGVVFTGIASANLKQYFEVANTRLIIMQFGGNIMPYTKTKKQVDQYIDKMRTQIQYIKYLAPHSDILFVGPSDMCERRDGIIQTYKMIPVMNKALTQMAIEEEIGYFSLYQAMGGKNSMVRWKEQGLAGGDYVHFTRKGADRAGQILADWLLKK
ncbi:MAG: hypothetical protein MJZ64_07045 [Paludibacteraceae bacterium]|nr:hypothetical protein [Paludibacteraceae bacterium]